jgi:hypothetical protein
MKFNIISILSVTLLWANKSFAQAIDNKTNTQVVVSDTACKILNRGIQNLVGIAEASYAINMSISDRLSYAARLK